MISKKILNNTLKGQQGAPRLKHKTNKKVVDSMNKYKINKDESPSPAMKTYTKSMATRFIKHESPSRMYAEKYYKLGPLDEGMAADLGAAAVQSASYAAIPAAFSLGASAAFSVASAISNLYKKYKWDRNGCDRIVNPEDRNQCEARFIDKYVAELRSQLTHCSSAKDPNECTQRLNATIQEQMQKKNDMFQTYQ